MAEADLEWLKHQLAAALGWEPAVAEGIVEAIATAESQDEVEQLIQVRELADLTPRLQQPDSRYVFNASPGFNLLTIYIEFLCLKFDVQHYAYACMLVRVNPSCMTIACSISLLLPGPFATLSCTAEVPELA